MGEGWGIALGAPGDASEATCVRLGAGCVRPRSAGQRPLHLVSAATQAAHNQLHRCKSRQTHNTQHTLTPIIGLLSRIGGEIGRGGLAPQCPLAPQSKHLRRQTRSRRRDSEIYRWDSDFSGGLGPAVGWGCFAGLGCGGWGSLFEVAGGWFGLPRWRRFWGWGSSSYWLFFCCFCGALVATLQQPPKRLLLQRFEGMVYA